jgi:sugar O-acyltransferase (sialic acid O-acetyltransferase NeuD family)
MTCEREANAATPLIILGAEVHAAEMAEIVERANLAKPTWNLLGFLSPSDEKIGRTVNGYPVLGSAKRIPELPQAAFVPSFGFPRGLLPPLDRMVSLVDPSAFVSRTATIGRGCAIYPHCFIGLNARVGDVVFALSGCVINHDDVIGDRVTLASRAALAGEVTVEPDCYLGQGCLIREKLTIGHGSLIGMGAVVVEDVLPNSVMAGNPARRLRDRT